MASVTLEVIKTHQNPIYKYPDVSLVRGDPEFKLKARESPFPDVVKQSFGKGHEFVGAMPRVCSPSFRQPSEDGWAHRIQGPISKFHLRRTQFHIHDSVDSMIYEQSDPAALIERIDFLDPTADCGPDSNARVDEMQLLGRVPWVSLSELGQLRS